MSDVTKTLSQIKAGDPSAADQLLPLVYDELRRLAARKMAQESPDHTLQSTALVHEAYIRLVGNGQSWDSRGHFFSAAAEAMRRILVENARRKGRIRHGGDQQRQSLDDFDPAEEQASDDLLVLDEALTQLGAEQEVVAEVVKLRYFVGLTIEETARVLDISVRTANRHWAFARAWLHQTIFGDFEADC